MTKPRMPKGLGSAGAALWRSMIADSLRPMA